MVIKMSNFLSRKIEWRNVFFFSLLFIIYGCSACIQFTSSMNIDAANALHEATLLFSGGKYFYQFYETTPPMFFYLYFPIVEAIKYFHSNHFFTIYFLFYAILTTLILVISAHLLKIKNYNRTKIHIMLIGLAAIILLQPPFYFGQREFVTFILTIPYYLLFSNRLAGHDVKMTIALFVGLLAGIGFSIEPHFCLAFLLSEGYLVFFKKPDRPFLRIESGFPKVS